MRKLAALLLLLLLILAGCAFDTREPTQTTAPTQPYSEPVSEPTTEPENTTVPSEPQTEATEAATAPAPEPVDTDFVRITDYIPYAREALAYATEDNFTGVVIYDFTEAYLRYGTLKKLMLAGERLAELGFGIIIWDAYRPVYGQQRLWDAYPDPAYVSPPGSGTQSHCRGCAVDITLYDLVSGLPVEMPTGFDDFSAYADRDYRDVSEEAAANALLLEQIMSDCGFRPYSAEWWHFTDTDSYDIEYGFDPAPIQ